MSLSRVGDTTAGAFILVGATGASGLELMQQLLELSLHAASHSVKA